MLFQTYVSIPSHIIEKIGYEIRRRFIKSLEKDGVPEEEIYKLSGRLSIACAEVANNYSSTCEGWSIDQRQAIEIANMLAKGERIQAIKMFRSATNSGLREAKEFIDKFRLDGSGAASFMIAFS